MNRSVDFRFDALRLFWDDKMSAAKRAIVHEARRRKLRVTLGTDSNTQEIIVRVSGTAQEVEQLLAPRQPKQIEPAVNLT